MTYMFINKINIMFIVKILKNYSIDFDINCLLLFIHFPRSFKATVVTLIMSGPEVNVGRCRENLLE